MVGATRPSDPLVGQSMMQPLSKSEVDGLYHVAERGQSPVLFVLAKKKNAPKKMVPSQKSISFRLFSMHAPIASTMDTGADQDEVSEAVNSKPNSGSIGPHSRPAAMTSGVQCQTSTPALRTP